MIDLINDDDVRDPYPVPFEWSGNNGDIWLDTGRPLDDETIWYPQIDGSSIDVRGMEGAAHDKDCIQPR